MLRTPLLTSAARVALAGLTLAASGCAKDPETAPAAAPAPYVAPAPAAPTAAYPQPAVTAATPAPAAAVPGAAPATGAMATPNAFALPCQNDASCGLAKCNVQFQKCAFPCQSAVDCAAGASCNTMTGLCLPGAAPQ
jgi:hypothetical protein